MFVKGPVYKQVVLSLQSPNSDHWVALPQGHLAAVWLMELGIAGSRQMSQGALSAVHVRGYNLDRGGSVIWEKSVFWDQGKRREREIRYKGINISDLFRFLKRL